MNKYNAFYKIVVSSPDRLSKILFVMRITIFLLFVALMEVSAAGHAQKISLSERNASILSVIEKLRLQSGYNFFYVEDNLKTAKPVNVQVVDAAMEEVLRQIFANQPLNYELKDKVVVIKLREKSFLDKISDVIHSVIKNINVRGKITDEYNKPLKGATVKIKGTTRSVITDESGNFYLENVKDKAVLVISYLGYKTMEIEAAQNLNGIQLVESMSELAEVVVSTGYQTLPKERATGSFVLIDSALLNRRVSTNILDRLDGVTSGLIFNKSLGTGNNAMISIRGRSTIFANPDPLIIVDNFPYEGDLNNINPNDIESISVLKDAAAASIWGVRAGNGVIVITTKKGKIDNKVHISFNVNTTISSKVDLHYQPQVSSEDFINLEQYLFRNGYFDNTINDGYSTISPAVAVFLQKRNKQISSNDSITKINQLKINDVRNDLENYTNRRSVKQLYAISLDGGSNKNTYYISAGYNKDLNNSVSSSYSRFTLNANNTYHLIDNKLHLSAALMLSTSSIKSNTLEYKTPLYPYEKLIGENGEHLSVVQSGGLRKQFTDTAGSGKLLDWNYRPLDENSGNNVTRLTDYKLNTTLLYNIISGLNLTINYQYEKGISSYTLLYPDDSYYTRNFINTYSRIDQTNGAVIRPVPLGAIENISNSNYGSNYGRAQINYMKKFGNKHDLNVLAGVEIKDYKSISNSNILYGFNTSTNSSIPVDYITYFPQYFGYGANNIPYGTTQGYTIDRVRSIFFNASYSYESKYILSASVRRDESNIFGVKTNQKGVPLWSSGLIWNISKEDFYHFDQLPILKLRITYGYNGNVDKTTSAFLTAQDGGTNVWNTQYTNIINPPNPSLRWEKDRNVNFGLDFATKKNLFSGSFEYYIKNGFDLIANSPIAPQTGVIQIKGNAADTRTTGIDFVLNKNSIGASQLKWQSTLLFSYTKDIITNYKVKQGNNAQIISGNYVNPVQGYPYNAIFSYPFIGLDNKGKPKGLLNGITSYDYASIENSTNLSDLMYNGSATPLVYGSFRNTFNYKGFDISINFTYKFDYFFRRPNVFSGSNYGSYGYLVADFDKRWQKSGDEFKTNIPALTYPVQVAQDAFFKGSSVLVEKADNIRLQDVKLSYNFKVGNVTRSIFKKLQLYAYLNNVGVIWKATKQEIDPDYVYSNFIDPKTISIGISSNF